MVGAIVDHLWQSLLVFALALLLVVLTQRHAAVVRLWLWRLTALKLALPFDALAAMGAWHGFPVNHSTDPVPASLLAFIQDSAPWLAPARSLPIQGASQGWLLAGLLLACAAALRWTLRRHAAETALQFEEALRRERDPDDQPPGVGFATAAFMTICALLLLLAPFTAGAVHDLQRRREVLSANVQSLRDATVTLMPARAGMGNRYRVSVDANGITVRNVTIQELTALAYGVSRFVVRGEHFYSAGGTDWLIHIRHDVRIAGRVVEPDDFDTYALRVPLTRALAQEYGFEIYLNDRCQPPCGKWGMAMEVDTGVL